MKMLKIAVLVSGNGTNLQAIIDSIENRKLDGEVVCVLSDNENANGLNRGRKHDIPSEYVRNSDMKEALDKYSPDIIVLAGYLSILTEDVIKSYRGRILNIHPSLIPKYCGKGFYGIKVHEAVINNNEIESGATVHLVDEGIDTGEILIQEHVEVFPDDTPLDLQKRVLKIEHKILIEGIKLLRRKI